MRRWRSSARGSALSRAAKGDTEAFAEFYDGYAEQVLVFLTRRTTDPEVAFDLTSEVFARALAGCKAFRGTSQAAEQAWLYAIVRNELNRFLQHGYLEREATSRYWREPLSISDEDIERIATLAGLQELRPRIDAVMGDLPDEQQQAIRLRVIEELTYSEVASRCGVSEQVVRARVSRGLRALGQALRDVDGLEVCA